jgi:hypothetical protein
MAPRLAGKVVFVNIGFDGPRSTFSRVHGDYDKAMTGVRAFGEAGLPVSLSAVVLRSAVHALPYLYQIADVLDAGKLKLILQLRKGNAGPARAGVHHGRGRHATHSTGWPNCGSRMTGGRRCG